MPTNYNGGRLIPNVEVVVIFLGSAFGQGGVDKAGAMRRWHRSTAHCVNIRPEGNPMTITSRIFEAYLKCPTKCWLSLTHEQIPDSCRAALESRITTPYLSTILRDLTAKSLHSNHGLVYVNRGRSEA
jgi:hypothetical protein